MLRTRNSMGYIERYKEMLSAKRVPFEVVDGQLFMRQNVWITPLGPAVQHYKLTNAQACRLQSKLGGWWAVSSGCSRSGQ